MIFLLLQPALADSCCATGGAQPTLLASCDALGVAFGVGGDLETGGWSHQGAWFPVGNDGGGHALFSAAMLGRFTPWLQGGLRVPVNLSVDSLDGEATTSLGVGSALLWLTLETPPGWPAPAAPSMALELGLGNTEHAKVVQVGLRVAGERGPWTAWGTLTARLPILGEGVVDGDSFFMIDRRLGEQLRGGLGVGLRANGGDLPGYGLSVGPIFVISPSRADRLLLTARAGLPLSQVGRSSPSLLTLHMDWFRVLAYRQSG